MFFDEGVGKKNKHKNRKDVWFEYKHKKSRFRFQNRP